MKEIKFKGDGSGSIEIEGQGGCQYIYLTGDTVILDGEFTPEDMRLIADFAEKSTDER